MIEMPEMVICGGAASQITFQDQCVKISVCWLRNWAFRVKQEPGIDKIE